MSELTKKKFYFVRHGKTDWNDKSLCQGQIDVPLNDGGRKEVERMFPLLETLSFSKIVSSPLLRAHETAQVIQSRSSLPITLIDGIKERGWGSMEGATSAQMYKVEEMEESDPMYTLPATIETRDSFKMRVLAGMNQALQDETPLIVSHGRVFLILTEILGIPSIRQIPNATVVECVPVGNEWQITLHESKE